jgi:uncharacterized protein YjiS (DUF1127 family)
MEPSSDPHPHRHPNPRADPRLDPDPRVDPGPQADPHAHPRLHPGKKSANESGTPDDVHVSACESTKGAGEPSGEQRLRLFRAMAALAGRQHGTVTASQLLDLGLERHDIAHAAERGRLHRLHQGVYLVGHTAMAPLAREHAALLACGAAGVLSHRTAAALWQLLPAGPVVDVTVVGRHVRRRRGVRLHRVDAIDLADIGSRHGLKITSPARTLVDLAAASRPTTWRRR